MINFNEIRIVGVDLGYGNIKTSRTVFPTGLTVHGSEPVFAGNTLRYNDKFYKIGEGHKAFISDKTADEDFYILTLAALAKELDVYNITDANIYIAAGLPLTWVKSQRDTFKEYITKNKEVEFMYDRKRYKLRIKGCSVFPQGYPAVFDRLSEMTGVNMLADIGNGTMNVMQITNKKPNEKKCYTEKIGVNQFMISALNTVRDNFGKMIDPAIIENFILNGTADISENYLACLRETAKNYCNSIFETLGKYDYDPDFMRLYIVGGGGRLIKNFGKYNSDRVIFIEDICAAAKGFERAALLQFQRKQNKGGV